MALVNVFAAIKLRAVASLQAALPERGKRMVFLASLARVINNNGFDKETRKKLNTVMQLAHSDASLMFPFELSEVIWQGRGGQEIFRFDPTQAPLTQDTIREMTQSVLETMPAWLRYGKPEEIEKDVSTLIQNRSTVFGF